MYNPIGVFFFTIDISIFIHIFFFFWEGRDYVVISEQLSHAQPKFNQLWIWNKIASVGFIATSVGGMTSRAKSCDGQEGGERQSLLFHY